MERRVKHHVILGDLPEVNTVKFTFDGEEIEAREGEMILAALLNQGKIVSRYTTKRHEPRGLFCGIGQCTDCAMIVDGKPNTRTCVTPVREGMVVETQDGYEPKKGAAK